MPNGITQSFLAGRGAALQQRASQLNQQAQEAELRRFTQRQNLESMVQGALQFQRISDPTEQDNFLLKRIDSIKARGGDPRDTIDFFNTPREQRQAVAQNVIDIGERFGVVQPGRTTKPFRGRIIEGVVPGRGEAFLRETQAGELVPIEGAVPRPKAGEIIRTTPEGGVEIIRGDVQPAANLPKPVIRDLTKSIANNENNLSRLDRIEKQFIPDFLTFGGRIGAKISSLKSKAGLGIAPQAKEFLGRRRKFTQNINQLFNAYRKEITGAAASVQELESLKKAMLSEDLSPIEFQAAYEEFRSELQRSNRLQRRLLREGITDKFGKSLDELFVAGEDDDIELRGAELRGQGLTDAEIAEKLFEEGF